MAAISITCKSTNEVEYHLVNTLDNQSAKNEWKDIATPHTLNIEFTDKDYILVNGNKSPIVEKLGVLYITTRNKTYPGINKDEGTIVTLTLAINLAIPAVTKTTSKTKYYMSSEIQSSATSYECKFNT